MLKAAVALILLLSAAGLRAQPAPPPPINFRKDLSLFADVQLFSDFANASAQGIQFRHQRSSVIGWRLSAGHIIYEESGSSVHAAPFSKDTITTRRVLRNMEGGFIGAGIEAQRQFYHKVYLYAGADLRIGYGTAQTDTALTYEYFGPSPFPPDTNRYHTTFSFNRHSRDGAGLLASATFLVGARILAGKRLIIGTEFSNPVYYTNSRTGDETGTQSNLSLSVSQVMQRLYVSYRFH